MSIPKQPLKPDVIYHIFNHAVGEENLFRNDENKSYFLKKLKQHILPIADILAYCIMANHFHIVLKIKSADYLSDHFGEQFHEKILPSESSSKRKLRTRSNALLDFINRQFANCFNSYAQAYNKMYWRKGSLFRHSFHRIELNTKKEIRRTICYIHLNPKKHGFTHQWKKWKFSSYKIIAWNIRGIVCSPDALKIFSGLKNFINIHDEYASIQ